MQDGGHSVNIETRRRSREKNKTTVKKALAFEEQRRENI